VEFSGPLVAPQTAVVRAKAGGTLLALAVAEGSRVRPGRCWAASTWPSRPAAWPSAAPLLDSARAALVQAERTHASATNGWRRSSSSPSRAGQLARRAGHRARQLNAAQASLETTRVGLRDATLLAPISGIVAKRHVLPGEKLSDGTAGADHRRPGPAGTGRQRGHARGAAHAPGMAVQVQVEGVDQPVAGRIARIAPAAEPGTRSIGVTIELPNPKETCAPASTRWPGHAGRRHERLTLPLPRWARPSGQDHVWLIENGSPGAPGGHRGPARRARGQGRGAAGRHARQPGAGGALRQPARRRQGLGGGQQGAAVASAAASTPVR
jgi:membrane fusion protein (multidrug efflux system)